MSNHRRSTPSHRWLIFGSHDRVHGADEDDASAHLPATAKFKPPQPDLLPASASAPSTYPAPGGCPITTQPSLSSGHADCSYAHDARGDRTMQEDVALSMSASGECTSRSCTAPRTPPSLAPPPRRRSKPTSTGGGTLRRRAILGNLIRQLTSKDPYNATVLVFVDGQSSRMSCSVWEDSFCEASYVGTSARPACPARPGARHPNPNANPNANAVGGTTPALLEGIEHGTPAGIGCRALQLLLPRPSDERKSVRAAVEARIRPVRLRVVVVGGSYGGANGCSCPKAYRNTFHSSPSKRMSSAMYICIPTRTALTAVRTPHFTDEALKMQHGGKVPLVLAVFRFGQQQHGAGEGAGVLYVAAEILAKRWWDSYVCGGAAAPSNGVLPNAADQGIEYGTVWGTISLIQ
ncbi:hypothetical protein MSAN_01502800 [Mycena sanguinolenta]|uniref:Uncharacterized protein n=1 Tax=Mycena sanguinolenta TaxID=230812 RepID=A0A8H6Y4K1_9AGAR|nr:hypothetical protein MSAN_01502800 [Mycena sanguinolenta]